MAIFVDLDISWAGLGHAGTVLDPYSYLDFVMSLPNTEAYFFKGSREFTANFSWDLTGSSIEQWELRPWRMYVSSETSNVEFIGGNISGGIIFSENEVTFTTPDTTWTECYLDIPSLVFDNVSSKTAIFNYCTVVFSGDINTLTNTYYNNCYVSSKYGAPTWKTSTPSPTVVFTGCNFASSKSFFETNLGTTSTYPTPTYSNVNWSKAVELPYPTWDNENIPSYNIQDGFGVGFEGKWANQDVGNEIIITASARYGVTPLSVSFEAQMPGIYADTYLWDFGDGYYSTLVSPTHVYNKSGVYDISLKVVDTSVVEHVGIRKRFILPVDLDISATRPIGRIPHKTKMTYDFDSVEGYSVESVEWDLGDNSEVSANNSVVHTYSNGGNYLVSLDAVVNGVELTTQKVITAIGPENYKGTKATGLVWIKNPGVNPGDTLILMAVSDPYDTVLDTDGSIKLEIVREGNDYRLVYFSSRSALINRSIKIDLKDGKWHFLSYECLEDGYMRYSIDGVELYPDSGTDEEGRSYSIAYSKVVRPGGGTLWAPYLYKAGQSVTLYQLRYGIGFNLGLSWIRELMDIDKVKLRII